MLSVKKKGKSDLFEINLFEDYYLQDSQIFALTKKYLKERKHLPEGVSKNHFYKIYLNNIRKNAINEEVFKELKVFFNILFPDEDNLIDYFNFFSNLDFDLFIQFYELIENELHNIANEKVNTILNSFISLRIKSLTKDKFKELKEKEINFYEEHIMKNYSRINLIKLGDIFFEKGDMKKALNYYEKTISLPQEKDKLYKSTLRKMSQIYEIEGNISNALYFLFKLHEVDSNHQLGNKELNRLLKDHHLINYFNELFEYAKKDKEEFTNYLKEIFKKRNIEFN